MRAFLDFLFISYMFTSNSNHTFENYPASYQDGNAWAALAQARL
jgi:hypothetical protein